METLVDVVVRKVIDLMNQTRSILPGNNLIEIRTAAGRYLERISTAEINFIFCLADSGNFRIFVYRKKE